MKGEEFALFQETQAEAFRMACTFARELAAGRRLTLGEMVRRMPLADPCDDAQTMAFLSLRRRSGGNASCTMRMSTARALSMRRRRRRCS